MNDNKIKRSMRDGGIGSTFNEFIKQVRDNSISRLYAILETKVLRFSILTEIVIAQVSNILNFNYHDVLDTLL